MLTIQTVLVISLSLIGFISWSLLLVLLAKVAQRYSQTMTNWSRFWLLIIAIAIMPLLPISIPVTHTVLPEALLSGITSSVEPLLQQASIVDISNQKIAWFSVVAMLLGFIFALSSLALVRTLYNLSKLNKLVLAAPQLTNLSAFSQQQQSYFKQKNINVYLLNSHGCAFVFGFLKPCLVLSEKTLALPPQQLHLLIEHELCHIKRHDPKVLICLRILSAVCWFNPAISYFTQRFLISMELNCDAEVLTLRPQDKLPYAETLLASIKLNRDEYKAQLMPYFSGSSVEKRDMEARIRAVMKSKNHGKISSVQLIVLGLITLFLLAGAVLAKPMFTKQILKPNESNMLLPVQGARISSGFGEVNSFRGPKQHLGIDFAMAKGNAVVATMSGIVVIADAKTLHGNYGKVVLIEHDNKLQSLYAHLDEITVQAGDYLIAGQKLGTVGTTGRVTGPHVHFELLKNGERVNPTTYLNLSN